MFGTVHILHLHQKGLLVLGSIGYLVIRINIHSLVPLSKRSQLPKRIDNMGRNQRHARRWSHFGVVFGQPLSIYLHSKEQVFHPWSLLPGQSSHHAVHVIEHVVEHCDNVMQCDSMSLRHPQGPISQWPQYIHHILHNGPLILSCAKWLTIRAFWILEPLACEFL